MNKINKIALIIFLIIASIGVIIGLIFMFSKINSSINYRYFNCSEIKDFEHCIDGTSFKPGLVILTINLAFYFVQIIITVFCIVSIRKCLKTFNPDSKDMIAVTFIIPFILTLINNIIYVNLNELKVIGLVVFIGIGLSAPLIFIPYEFLKIFILKLIKSKSGNYEQLGDA